jgi:hypothetical protein
VRLGATYINETARTSGFDPANLEKAIRSTLDGDFREYDLDRCAAIDQSDVQRLLYPVLRSDDRPTSDRMLAVVAPLLERVLDHQRERGFLEAMAAGSYQPELLFPNGRDIVQRISRHPALLWKAENVAKYLSTREK